MTSESFAVPEHAAIEVVRSPGRTVVIAVEGGESAARVAAAIRDRVGQARRVDELAAAWRAGVALVGDARLSAAIIDMTGSRASIIHAGDLAIHAVGAERAWALVEPHTNLHASSAMRIRTRGVNLPPPADRAELAEVTLDDARHIAIASASVWAPLGDALDRRLLDASSAEQLVSAAIGADADVSRAVSRVPRVCAIVAVPAAEGELAPAWIPVDVQRRARRAVRARLATMIGSRGVVIVGARGCGKSAVLDQLARHAAVDRSATLVRPSQVRRALKSGLPLAQPGQTVLCDGLVDAIAASADQADALADAIRTGTAFVTTATREELGQIAALCPRLYQQLQAVELASPSSSEVLAIVEMWAPRFASRHRCTIEPDVVRAAVELSKRFALGGAQPEAALFLLEQACVRAGNANVVSCSAAGRGSGVVDRSALSAAIADHTGIALELVESDEGTRASQLAERLAGRLHGQRTATDRVASTVLAGVERRARGQSRGPLATMLLLGPTGTGKTETGRLLAEAWFCDRRAITVIDLSEYRDPSSVTKLTGASPGYVGFGQPPTLAISLGQRPRQVIVFDELEKACAEVQLLLLQILDEGRLSTGSQATIDFREAIIVLTSNLLADPDASVGFAAKAHGSSEARDRATLEARLRPELVARIDAVIRYEPLTRDAARLIALAHLSRAADALIVTGRLAPAELPALRKRLLEDLPKQPAGGAREVLRAVDRLLAEHRPPSTPREGTPLVLAYPYLDAGRSRLAAGFLLQLRDGIDPDEVATAIIGHPAASGLLYLAHDDRRVIAIVGDEHQVAELTAACATFGEARCASGRVVADLANRATGELVDRLLSGGA